MFFGDLGLKPDFVIDASANLPPAGSDSLINAENINTGLIGPAWSTQPWTLKKWLMAGVIDEDAPDSRCLAHFYNPLGVPHCLTDPIILSGRDSFVWAARGDSFIPIYSWIPGRYSYPINRKPENTARPIWMVIRCKRATAKRWW